MVKSNTTIMTVGILVGLIFTWLPCLEALSPMGAPMMSPGTPMPMAPAPATDCTTALFSLADCLGFVQDGSNLTVPDKACCPELAGLLKNNPICLCGLITHADDYSVNVTKALTLPSACKLQTPPLDACPATPGSAPTPGSASEAPGSASEAPGAASDAPGSTAGPGPNGGGTVSPVGSGNDGTNGASGTAVHDLSTIVCLALAIFIAYYF
ncbi:hypothetical protein L1987_50957 [Smallanthus sonchifolius]|uniref:Uncharacterized protein n=1 Tax=Smallanthus sonchifolius TaxID=185202 RepID=A0ACB9EPA4_9ASTR|nr:hypothetical protein L1987_50957 [Smallanthus sonchifolius]